MNANERLIAEVNGSMSIEGMTLTKADRDRMMRYLRNPEDFGRIIKEIKLKYQASDKDHA